MGSVDEKDFGCSHMVHGFTPKQIIESFDVQRIDSVISEVKHESYYDYHMALEKAAGEINTAGNALLAILSAACSMMFTRDGAGFGPYIQLGDGRRSPAIEDFKGDVAEVLLGVYDKFENPILKSRVSDILWVNRRIHGSAQAQRFATCALDGYRAIPIDYDGWYMGRNEEVWFRAVTLAKSLRKQGLSYVDELEKKLVSAFLSCPTEEKSLLIPIGRVLLESGLDVKESGRITERLEARLATLANVKDVFEANDYFDLLIRYYRKIGDKEAENRCCFEKGEANRRAGDAWSAQAVDSGMLSARYEEAQRCYDKLPRSYKIEHGVVALASEVRKSLHAAYKKTSESMQLIRGKRINISRYIRDARKSMHGLEIHQALSRLVGLHRANVKDLQVQARKILEGNPLYGHFSLETFEGDRLAARMDGVSIGDSNIEESKRFLWIILQQYRFQLELSWKAYLLPSFRVLREEHEFEDGDCFALVKLSRFVPENRRFMFARGLKAGFYQDFQTAAALLIPQIENSVRVLLKAHGVDTFARSGDLDCEVGLSALVDREDFKVLFDDNLGFELKAMFGSAPNFNLRNQYAHGMVDDCFGCGMFDFMVWHLGLKLVTFGCVKHPEKVGLKLPSSIDSRRLEGRT